MRVVIDLQAVQGSNRSRGIGRYSLSLVKALAEQNQNHELIIVLSDQFIEAVKAIRQELRDLVPAANIRVWSSISHVAATSATNHDRRNGAEILRETFLQSLVPDVVIETSLFEGFGDDVVTSVSKTNYTGPTVAVLYDLIPHINRETYLGNSTYRAWYEQKLAHLRNCDLLLAISESSREEAIDHLGFPHSRVINVSADADARFKPFEPGTRSNKALLKRLGLKQPFVMYTGGIDPRKNVESLIEAFAALSTRTRNKHQLAIVCSVQDGDRVKLSRLASELGLTAGSLVLTGYVSDAELVELYRTCKLFVFPSWHEGFGLPVLEAMRCGRAVLAGDRSSLPEVVGDASLLFDPFDQEELRTKMEDMLVSDDLRSRAERHSLLQAEKFSWRETARRAWQGLEQWHGTRRRSSIPSEPLPRSRPTLAFVSPVPPLRSGISDYSSELLPELNRHYKIDVIVRDDDVVGDEWISANCRVRPVSWFAKNANRYDRILYHFGNSEFHIHMFELIDKHPGVVVLHDFFLSGIVAHRDVAGYARSSWASELCEAHGWQAVVDRYKAADTADVVWKYPCNLSVLQAATGVIVHSDFSRRLARDWYGAGASSEWALVPLLRSPLQLPSKREARAALGVRPGDFLVCSFGLIGRMKMNHRLLAAWRASSLTSDRRCRLVFVGKNSDDAYGIDLQRTVREEQSEAHVEITGWIDIETFRLWLAAADVGVQLRTLSRGETSAAVLDCMNAALATIVNANGFFAELPTGTVRMLEDDFADEALTTALEELWQSEPRRRALGERGQDHIRANHQPRACADHYRDAIEGFYETVGRPAQRLARSIKEAELGLSSQDWARLARAASANAGVRPQLPRLLVDISELVQRDFRSGIQRVVRAVLNHWIKSPPQGYLVEPIYAPPEGGSYKSARKFISRLLEIPDDWSDDLLVDPAAGDVFVGLDLLPSLIPLQVGLLEGWRQRGVQINFVIYDLLPVIMPEFFYPRALENHESWLSAISMADKVVCISRAVADDYIEWLQYRGPKRDRPLSISWFHLGSDKESSIPTKGLPSDTKTLIDTIRSKSSYLVVGTIEPRKGLSQVLEAFDRLWNEGFDVALVLVGKMGWMMEQFHSNLISNPMYGKSLFWLEGASDQYLEQIYGASSCLIAASEGEGFGLPLIEASRLGRPVLARDIPVFREVAPPGTRFFDNEMSPSVIVDAVRDREKKGDDFQPRGTFPEYRTWQQSAEELAQRILGEDRPYREWMPDGVRRFWANDARLYTKVGTLHRRQMKTTGEAGFLIFGPYIYLDAGLYILTVEGNYTQLVGAEFMDVSSASGAHRHCTSTLSSGSGKWHATIHLQLDDAVSDLEVRISVDRGSEMSFGSLIIEAEGDDQTP